MADKRTFRDVISDFLWHLVWSDYTTWRQDRAYRKHLKSNRDFS